CDDEGVDFDVGSTKAVEPGVICFIGRNHTNYVNLVASAPVSGRQCLDNTLQAPYQGRRNNMQDGQWTARRFRAAFSGRRRPVARMLHVCYSSRNLQGSETRGKHVSLRIYGMKSMPRWLCGTGKIHAP